MVVHTPLLTTIVVGLVLASILGAVANFFRISPLVGYLLAGVVVGPFTPGLFIDPALTGELAEIGIILLMFGVGLHFSLKDLLSVKAIAIPGAMVQIVIATLLGMVLAWFLGWPPAAGLVFGLALSVASTVVLLRALQDRRIIDSERGRIAVGWLIVEDIAMVLALVLLPAIAEFLKVPVAETTTDTVTSTGNIFVILAIAVGKIMAFIAVMLVVGRRVIPLALQYIVKTGSREMFSLTVLAIALGVAYGSSELFGVSFALGAFFAGMILGESELSQQAAEESLPLRDAFAVLFFVSVGLMVDPMIMIEDPLAVLATVLIIVFGKSIAAFLIVLAFRYPVGTAITISASLAQIGEFSFILAGLGVMLDLLPERGRDLILAGAILSIVLNPFIFMLTDKLVPWLERKYGLKTESDAEREANLLKQTTLTGHAVIVGFGRVGHLVGEKIIKAGKPILVIEERSDIIEELREKKIEFLYGNAASRGMLEAANIKDANWLLIATPNVFEAGQILQKARTLNPNIEIVTRAHSKAEIEYLKIYGAEHIIMGEQEIAKAMIQHVLTGPEQDSLATP